MGQAKDIFETTLADFKKRLTPKEHHDFEFTTLEDVRKVIGRIQREQENTKSIVNMTRIQSFLEAMDQFSKVIEVFLNTSEFVAFVWGPMKFLLQVASTWAFSFETLLEAYEEIGERIPLLGQYKALFDGDLHMRKVLGLIYVDILEFHRGAVRFFSGPVWRQVFRAVWKDFQSRFKHILGALGRHKELIESQAAILHFRHYQEDRQVNLLLIQQYERDRLQLIEHIENVEEAESQKKYTAVMEWISSPQTKGYHEIHESFCKTRREYPGTGDWILKHEKVQNWKEAETPVSSILWLNGIPGAGKTILASVIIDACMQESTFVTSYFYCKEGDQERNTGISVFRALLGQLLSQIRDMVPYCHDKYLTSGDTTLTSTNLATQLLGLFCQKIPKQYIIIDGLDECDTTERKLLLSTFIKMVDDYDKHDPGKLRVLFVSQHYNDIKKSLQAATVISLEPEDNQGDISLYVDWWAPKIQHKYGLDDDQIEHIKTSTCARAQGMFLYAKLVMGNLYAQPTKQQILGEIEISRFPQGLEQAYERIMSRIKRNASPEEWKIVHKLLGWMACAKRTLKWHEIQGAVSIEPNGQTIDFDDRKLRFDIGDLCGSLIQVSPGDRIELVHSTAKFYIVRTGHLRELTVECNLTALCLQYLTFECFDSEVNEDILRQFALSGYFAFQDYAIAKWFFHLHAMVNAAQNPISADSDLKDAELKDTDLKDALKEINNALEDFRSYYGDEIEQHEPVFSASEEACEAFKDYSFHENLVLLWSHVYRHQEKGIEARNDVSIKLLGDALIRNRKLLEELTSSKPHSYAGGKPDLNTFYGEKRYKCPKLTCFYFHEGFKDAKSRDPHIHRHTRPFNCTFPDCSVVEFGFASNNELEKHMRSFHPDITDQAKSFAAPKVVPATTQWRCEKCDKNFTRNFHLRNHRRAHNGERPFACSECGKGFARANDCKRHEKIHARR